MDLLELDSRVIGDGAEKFRLEDTGLAHNELQLELQGLAVTHLNSHAKIILESYTAQVLKCIALTRERIVTLQKDL